MINQLLGGNFNLTSIFIFLLSACAVVFITLPIHEFSHGFVATKLGDPTPRYQNRLSLNPLRHIDYLGAAMIVLFGFGWAKPVQVNVNYFKNPKRDMAITALAGPASNILVSFFAGFLMFLLTLIPMQNSFFIYTYLFFEYLIWINLYLAFFNLIPIPPLDGSRLLATFLPDRIYYRIMQYERFFFLLILLLCWRGSFGSILEFAVSGVYRAIHSVFGLAVL
ncbi:MAG: site-2 protease family protein, partial [bacterium]|nr:site-2 protease family protein [bacterium]